MSEVTYNIVTVTRDKNVVGICAVTIHNIKTDYDIILKLRETAKTIYLRTRYNYSNLVFSPDIKSHPEEFKWDDSQGPYSQLR